MQSPFAELEHLVRRDLELRSELVARGELFGGYHPEMETVHSENGRELESLIDEFGWPQPARDGSAACDNAWLVVIHAISLPSLQRKALEILKSNSDGCTSSQLAMLEDRTLVFSGRKQKFGTQFDWNGKGALLPYPIEDEAHVDARRVRVGLPPLSEAILRHQQRSEAEREKPPADFAAYIRGQKQWMLRTGWIRELSEIDPAYEAFRAHE